MNNFIEYNNYSWYDPGSNCNNYRRRSSCGQVVFWPVARNALSQIARSNSR